MRKCTTEEFIEKAKTIHCDYYDYSKVEYKDANTKVCIICPIHGEFWMTPSKHINHKQKCPRCQGKHKTTEIFIAEAKFIHGDKYDYSKVEYINSYTKVCIICPTHGEFWQTPHKHLNGNGCNACAKERAKNATISNIEDFIKKAQKTHGNKYDYSKVNYINCKTKVCIICPIHGEFWQTPDNHIQGKGCPNCCSTKKLTKETFIEKAIKTHGNKYDYSKVEYINNNTKICIICPIHGEFWQTPANHLNGNGCPSCKTSHLEEEIFGNNIQLGTK